MTLFTQLRCKHPGGMFFSQVSAKFESQDNWIKILTYHYCFHHLGFTPEDVLEEAKIAMASEEELEKKRAEADATTTAQPRSEDSQPVD